LSVDELIPEARRLAVLKGNTPSKGELMRAFRIGHPRATELLDKLAAEAGQRRAQARRRFHAVRGRKGVGRPLPRRFAPLPNIPVSPGVGPAPDRPFPPAPPAPRKALEGPVGVLPTPSRRPVAAWPLVLLAAPAFVAIWSGWVDLGRLTGFGVVHPLPGIWDDARLNTAITLPIGLETYGAYALYVWLAGAVPAAARRFARWSAIGSLGLGMAGQAAYHLMVAAGWQHAPWPITATVACIPVVVLGLGAALHHLTRTEEA
jgi:hypothetical protein